MWLLLGGQEAFLAEALAARDLDHSADTGARHKAANGFCAPDRQR